MTERLTQTDLKLALNHVRWIGGATDSGKTTIAHTLAERYGLQVYHYDHQARAHHDFLAKSWPGHNIFLNASLEERWVQPEPEDLFDYTLQIFERRFPLVIENLLALPGKPLILAEGFGFTPELLLPYLSDKQNAIWLIPTADFKWASMERRNKPSFQDKLSDPKRGKMNLFKRDMLVAEAMQAETEAHSLKLVEVDGSLSIEEMVDLVGDYFQIA